MPDITKQDILAWLDMQRDAVNTEIVYAAPSEQKQYHGNLQIINHLAELEQRDGEMTAVEFLGDIHAIKQICMARAGCFGCPFDAECPLVSSTPPRRAVEIVKKWKEERDGH